MDINSKEDLIEIIKGLQADNIALNERLDGMTNTQGEELPTEETETEETEEEEIEADEDEIEKLLFDL